MVNQTKKPAKPDKPGAGDAPQAAQPQEPEELPKTLSQIAREEAEHRALLRRQRFKRRWPEVTKVKIPTKPWHPPGPPKRRPPIVWHNFTLVDKNKMILQGNLACNSKRYSPAVCGAQTACIAAVCRALLEEKTPAELVHRDVDEVIKAGDLYYKQCLRAMKCYKGKRRLQLNQLLTSFFFHDARYTIKLQELERGLLDKQPDSVKAEPDLFTLMEKRTGSKYTMILSVGDTHFLIWGNPPDAEAGSNVKTICYIFNPHMLNEFGEANKLFGAAAFLRYPGVTSFVLDFLSNFDELDASRKASSKYITLTSIEVCQTEPLLREPDYELDLKALKIHCENEWFSMQMNALMKKKLKWKKGKRATERRARKGQNTTKEPSPQLPVPPERPPPALTHEQIMSMRGEDFFLYCPRVDDHNFGRDDMVKRPKPEKVLHSFVEIAEKINQSQYVRLDTGVWILRGTRHMASYRYQTFKTYTGITCCVAALAILRKLRARAWNEDTVDETLDLGFNLYKEILEERRGPIRRIVLAELKDNFMMWDREYKYKLRDMAVWGNLVSNDPKDLDLFRGVEQFFKEADSGVLQIPGEYETAIWNEGGKYYLYHPWPADKYGHKVGLREGGKACILRFTTISGLCEFFMQNVYDMRNKPYLISELLVIEREPVPESVNNMKSVAPGRWVLQGSFHEGDDRFPEDRRNKQATPASIAAIAMAHIINPLEWTTDNVDETVVHGDILYEDTMTHLEKMGINRDAPKASEEVEGEEEEVSVTGYLAAGEVLNKFKISDYDYIETNVIDGAYNGQLNPDSSGILSLKDSLKQLFNYHTHAVLTARGNSYAIWKQDDCYYLFDPHGCDENGYTSDEPRSTACLIRLSGSAALLADSILANLPPGPDDSFNISPVAVTASRLIPELGAPEIKLETKGYEWLAKKTAAILMGARGENTAIGRLAKKAGIGDEDMAGRTLALPAAAAFVATADSVPPPNMHQEHIYNFLEAGTDYYLNLLKKTGKKELGPEDLTEKFEMGAKTLYIELEEPIKLPLRLPDEPPPEGEESSPEKVMEEGAEEEEEKMKQIKDALFKMWYDNTKSSHVALLLGDYHQLGVWVSPGGKVVAYDPAPTLAKGMLTPSRIKKGDEIRLQLIKDEMSGEGGAEEEEDEVGDEGEQQPEPEPEFVPPESCAALMVFSGPGEFIDRITLHGPLDKKQCLAPYKLYPVKVTNELTSVLKEKKAPPPKAEGEEVENGEEEEELLIEPLEDSDIGKYFTRLSRGCASVQGRVAQHENYFMEQNRDRQDAAIAVMGIAVEHIEPYIYWKPQLIDAIMKYGDRLYTLSLPHAANPPIVTPTDVVEEFRVTKFDIRLEIQGDAEQGDLNAGESKSVLNVPRALLKFFESNKYGVISSKNYCVAIWKAADDKSFVLWEPHSVGPGGRTSAVGCAACVLFSTVEAVAEVFRDNVKALGRDGSNRFSIAAVKVFWELTKTTETVPPQSAVPDDMYETKVLTAFVEIAKGRTILRGSRPQDLAKFTRESLLQSSCGAIVGACMTHLRKPKLWTRRTVDEVMLIASKLFAASLGSLGYEFCPGEDVLLPLQVLKRFVLGVNYIRYDLAPVFTGKLELKKPTGITVRSALERFFETQTHGILWSMRHAVAVWRVPGTPSFYMMEPHACGPTGQRTDAQDDGAACVLTFTSPKLMAFAYLENVPAAQRFKHDFELYAIHVTARPIKKLGEEPPLVKAPPGIKLVPATSKVGVDRSKRRALEKDRKHPPGSATCLDAQRAAELKDKEEKKLKGQRNTSGWLVLNDGTQFLSAQHSIACKKFPYASRGNQALACSVMAVAMSRVEDVCRWCSITLDEILESGDQLYQDSYLHFRPETKILTMEQVLRKFYTPGNCVCRVIVYEARQKGSVNTDLEQQMSQFFREEKSGVFVAGSGEFAVALFRTPRGYYMFDPADRDRYGRAVAPPCRGRAKACFSQYPNVSTLAEKLGANIPPVIKLVKESADKEEADKEVHFEEPATFAIYGMDVALTSPQ